MQPLTLKQTRHLAKLAHLNLDPRELNHFSSQITGILGHVQSLQELDVASEPETNQVTQTRNRFRSDTVTPSLTQDQALSQASATHQGYFVVAQLISHE